MSQLCDMTAACPAGRCSLHPARPDGRAVTRISWGETHEAWPPGRLTALVLTACAGSILVAACSAGAGPTSSGSAASSSAASSSAAPSRSAPAAASSPSAATAGRTITVNGPVGSFPVPAGADVVENFTTNQESGVIFQGVTPAQVSRFYATALPRAGYTISINAILTRSGGTAASVEFAGHGFKGSIDTLSDYAGTGVSIAGLGHKNVTTVAFFPQ